MPISQDQKKFIKKTLGEYSSEELSLKLGIKKNEIERFLQKKLSSKKYEKLINKKEEFGIEEKVSNQNFSFGVFFQENLWIFFVLLFLVLISYFNAWDNGFVSDDLPGVLNNPQIGSIEHVFEGSVTGFPQKLLYFLIFHLDGANPTVFRTFNIFFHLGSVFLIFSIFTFWKNNKRLAFLVAAIFAVHPVLVESIAWISGMPYSAAGFFILLSFWKYLQDRKSLWALFFFLLALTFLEKVMFFPVVLPLFNFLFLSKSEFRKSWKRLIPYFSLTLLWTVIFLARAGERVTSVASSSTDQGGSSFFNPLIQFPAAVSNYLGLIFWPQKLTLYHTEMSFSRADLVLFWLVLFVFVGAIILAWKKNKFIFFWLAFFVIMLLPVLTPLKIAWIVAERYVYLSSLGIFVVLALFFEYLFQKFKNQQHLIWAVFGILIISLSIRTIVRNGDWQNEDSLWIATAQVSPSGENIHNNLGDVYTRQGDLQKAIEEFRRAIEINPHYADAYHNLGNAFLQNGQIEKAQQNYQKALENNPNLWQSHQQLAAIYFNQQNYQKALEEIEKALQIDPQNENLLENKQVIESKL